MILLQQRGAYFYPQIKKPAKQRAFRIHHWTEDYVDGHRKRESACCLL